MFRHYLDLDTIHKLMECIVNSQMNTEVVRAELLTAIHPGFVAQLPGQGNPTEKIRGDLMTMNTVSYLENYEVPLRLWLQNARYRLRSASRPERVYFEQVLEDVTAQSQALIQEAQGQSRDVGTLDSLERIVHKDDMLAFGWLEEGLMIGKSVARLVVLRYDNGTVASSQYYGTGWLLGPQHLITNHHVINARADGEQDASEIDLRLQATHMQVQFDYNSQGMTGERAAVAELCAWVTRHNDPALDYAVVKLSELSTRTPLTLAPNVLDKLAKHKQPVNIIQHPGGQPKMLGIRNNQVHELTQLELSYFTDTEGGSSGSPVCDDAWRVVALHRRWNRFINKNVVFQGKPTAWDNRGTRIDRIIEHLQLNYPDLWKEIGTRVATP
jgi:hypothetical protein